VNLLLDHCVPKRFGRELQGHAVKTTFQMGWADIGNGSLLALAAGHFGAFVTVDQNIRFQHNLSTLPLPVLILIAEDNKLETLKPYAAYVLLALSRITVPELILIYRDGRIEIVARKP
jgi:ABC-type sulfate transport system permease subunit